MLQFANVDFCGGKKTADFRQNTVRARTINSNHLWHLVQDFNSGQATLDGRQERSLLCYPYYPTPAIVIFFTLYFQVFSQTHYFFSKLNTLHSLTWLSLWPHTFLFMSTLMPNMIHWCQTVLLNTLSTKPCYFYFQIRNQYVSNHHVSVLSPLSLFSHGQSHMLKTIIILCLATL